MAHLSLLLLRLQIGSTAISQENMSLVTNMGKFLDPLADKLLVSAALIILVELGTAPSWIVIVIISREFAVTGLRLNTCGRRGSSGCKPTWKIKTMAQIVAISSLLLNNIFLK